MKSLNSLMLSRSGYIKQYRLYFLENMKSPSMKLLILNRENMRCQKSKKSLAKQRMMRVIIPARSAEARVLLKMGKFALHVPVRDAKINSFVYLRGGLAAI